MWIALLQANGFTTVDATCGPLAARLARVKAAKGTFIVVANYDVAAPLAAPLLAMRPKLGFVVLDESHWIKSPSAKRAKACRRLCWAVDYVRLLTGTPIPNNYGDLWGQMTCIDPEQWSTAYGKFAAKHLVRHPIYPTTIIGYIDLPELLKLTEASSHTVRREDVFGPDQYQFVRRPVALPVSAMVLYRVLAKEWVLDSPKMSAEHVLKRLVRLQQLTSGYLPLDEGGIKEVHTAKIDAVLADLDEIFETGEKVILFAKFRWEISRYEAEIKKRFPAVPVHIIAGGVSSADRAAAIDVIADSVGSAIVIAQTQAGGIGISFAEAKHVMFVSSSYSFVGRKQAMDRIYKPGLIRCVTDYIVEGTIDVSIEKAVAAKSSLHESLRGGDRTSIVFGE
jgi:SNF2 family DNA or RNA helicase